MPCQGVVLLCTLPLSTCLASRSPVSVHPTEFVLSLLTENFINYLSHCYFSRSAKEPFLQILSSKQLVIYVNPLKVVEAYLEYSVTVR